MEIVGHRGFPVQARENTLDSFEAAIKAGADGVELDVRRTMDGVYVIHHDFVFKALNAPVDSISYKDMVRAEPSIATLDQVFELVNGRVWLDVEIKTPTDGPAVAELVRDYSGEAMISSFSKSMIAEIRLAVPEVRVGLLVGSLSSSDLSHEEESSPWQILEELDLDLLISNMWLLKTVAPEACKRGIELWAWTADLLDELQVATNHHATCVITNNPALLVEGLDQIKPPHAR